MYRFSQLITHVNKFRTDQRQEIFDFEVSLRWLLSSLFLGALVGCGQAAVIRSDVGDFPWNGGTKDDLTIALYYLPERRLHVYVAFDGDGKLIPSNDKVTYGLLSGTVPGQPVRVRFPKTLDYHSIIKVTTDGTYLTGIDTDVTDQTPAAIQAVLKDLTSLVPGASSSTGGAGDASALVADKSVDSSLTQRANKIIDLLIEPTNEAIGAQFNFFYSKWGVCLHAPDGQLPMSGEAREPAVTGEDYKAEHGYPGVVVPMVSAYHADLIVNDAAIKGACPANGQSTFTLDTLVPNPNRLVALNVARTEWVQHHTVYNFNQGIFKDASIDRGSVLVSVASLPLDVLKAILSVPAQLIQFRINYDTTETNRAKAEATLLTQLAALQKLKDSPKSPPAAN